MVGDEPPFDLHFDDAPTFYVSGQPDRTDPRVRKLEPDLAGTTALESRATPRATSAAAFQGREIDERAARTEVSEAERIVAAAHRLAQSG